MNVGVAGRRSIARGLLVVLALGATALFLLLAATRRLNFDESLALRAGRLEWLRSGAEPPFVMPATLAYGAASLAIADPGRLFLVLRLAVALAVLGAFAALLRAARLPATRAALATLFLLAMAAFATHGLEFRYDAAILVGLMLAVAAAAHESPRGFAAAGAALAFVALHQTKGLVLGAALLVYLALAPSALRRRIPALLAGAAAVVAPWLLLLAARGLVARWLATYTFFGRIGAGAPRVALAGALGPTMLRDLAWWCVAALALAATLRAASGRERSPVERAALVAALGTLGFTLLHPHPWPYMLALPAPFLALVVARRWPAPGERRESGAWLGLLAAALLLQAAIGRGLPFATHRAALAAPRAPEVRLLRALAARAAPGDAVLDPSGLVYFLPPCTRQWYTDGLFVEAARRGEWMGELAGGVPASCTWAVNSYRLGSLPPAAVQALMRDYRPWVGALAMRSGMPAGAAPEAHADFPREIENFW